MNNKKISIIALGMTSFVVIAGVGLFNLKSNNKVMEESNNIVAESVEENEEIVINKNNEADLLIDYSKMENLLRESDVVAVVKVTDAEGKNYNPVRREYVPVYTTGTLEVEKILKVVNESKVEEGKKIEYVRLGGSIKYSEYLKGLTEAERTKIESVVNSNEKMRVASERNNIVLKDKFVDDIEVEAGKEYVVFLKYVSDYNKYNIVGFEHGLREYDNTRKTMKNNVTNEFESLSLVK